MTHLRYPLFILALLALTHCGSGDSPAATAGTGDSANADVILTGQPASPLPTDLKGAVLFVTAVPRSGFSSQTAVFNNHIPRPDDAPRGGDLWIRYGNGTLRNLTKEAGYGMDGLQLGSNAITVRQPSVHWSGTKALFAMAMGAPSKYQYPTYTWQIYEITGYGIGQTPVITAVPGQPKPFNNVSPIYSTDDQIIFATDMPRDGAMHLYPLLDEYESAPCTSGIWKLNPTDGTLAFLTDSPSGDFDFSIDDAGRVIFTRWDHLKMDGFGKFGPNSKGAINYASEQANAVQVANDEYFPEHLSPGAKGIHYYIDEFGTKISTHDFNHFFPWEVNVDGSDLETVNHVGRHELGGSFTEGSVVDDKGLSYLNPVDIANTIMLMGSSGIFQIKQDPITRKFCGTFSQEFKHASSGNIVCFHGEPGMNPEDMVLELLTSAKLGDYTQGHYRNPVFMTDGTVIASHTGTPDETSDGEATIPNTLDTSAKAKNPNVDQITNTYDFRLKTLKQVGSAWVADKLLTTGIQKRVQYFSPDTLKEFNGTLWELDAVEVQSRATPAPRQAAALEDPELSIFKSKNVDVAAFKSWLKAHKLALIISRNVTSRDRADIQQPYNLQVPGGVKTIGKATTPVYDITHLQFFQGDRIRGYLGDTNSSATEGRRILATTMHDKEALDALNNAGQPNGSVQIATDGSVAAFVPAQRALTWQTIGPEPTHPGKFRPVVRERNWLSFAPGEIRLCANCHGINKFDQALNTTPTNPPAALAALLDYWKTLPH